MSIRGSSRYDWYFDGGCSQHMTCEKSYIEGLKTYSQSVMLPLVMELEEKSKA